MAIMLSPWQLATVLKSIVRVSTPFLQTQASHGPVLLGNALSHTVQIQPIATLIDLFISRRVLEQLLELHLRFLCTVMRVQSPLDVPEPYCQYEPRANKLDPLVWECDAHLSICLSGLAPPFLSAALNAASLCRWQRRS
jgi:hypothetical protein